ncbi:MAG: tyrosine-type recombinase/integrase [Gammaproteobacteria bacterium]|nr:tyrosine-type recombinase/integrase [Gammaproteobacteria bacterium]MDE0280338.1 tyrosine-type recombinase/integrase [Gammaproteobacteria bacterium]
MKLEGMRISKRTVEALKADRDTVFWDSELPGFGVRVYPGGGRCYVVQTRKKGEAARRVTVGRHGVITPEVARERAALTIARIKAGEKGEPGSPAGPAGKPGGGPTVGELAGNWLDDHVAAHCKETTRASYRLIVNKHIVPAIGGIPASELDHARVSDLHHSLRGTPVMANQVVKALSHIWNMAQDRGELPEGENPCRLVVRYRRRRRDRFLGEAELRRLGRVLSRVEAGEEKGVSVHAAVAIRLLLLTGCRKNEILSLRWKDVNLEAGEIRLEDSKTGGRTVSLSPEAVAVLSGIRRIEGNPHVIPGRVAGDPLRNLNHPWKVVCGKAEIEGVRIHDCRHSFASRALALGESLPAIGKLLGHSQVETTSRYAHLGQEAVRESAIRISDSIAAYIL